MAIQKIDMERCRRCGMCEFYCPVDVIRFDHEKKEPDLRYAHDCMVCGLCEDRCPAKAITVTPEKSNAAVPCWG
ncbi:MAG: iron-sulfur-binding protein [Bacillota bacterium]|jgi:pyruvate ferredoxin oxidoreductase delta subunit|nr:iron-sulfur-binding protein [Bacillota bacterium]